MPTYRYAEKQKTPQEMDRFANGSSVFDDIRPMHSFVTWDVVKVIAKKYLTQKQCFVLAMKARGMKQVQIAQILNISQQAVSDRYKRAVVQLRSKIYKYMDIVHT